MTTVLASGGIWQCLISSRNLAFLADFPFFDNRALVRHVPEIGTGWAEGVDAPNLDGYAHDFKISEAAQHSDCVSSLPERE
jgi:hypothetical protein